MNLCVKWGTQMIIYAQHSIASSKKDLFRQMHEQRAQVFSDRLKWDVSASNGQEIDEFDGCNPLYVMSVSKDGKTLLGSVRLLKTVGPNMLRDVFSELLEPDESIASPTIWESSRFCISPSVKLSHDGAGPNHQLNSVTIELLIGIVDAALTSGIKQVVSVFDARMFRILRSAGCYPEIVGKPCTIGKVKTYAGLFAINQTLHRHLLRQMPMPKARTNSLGEVER